MFMLKLSLVNHYQYELIIQVLLLLSLIHLLMNLLLINFLLTLFYLTLYLFHLSDPYFMKSFLLYLGSS